MPQDGDRFSMGKSCDGFFTAGNKGRTGVGAEAFAVSEVGSSFCLFGGGGSRSVVNRLQSAEAGDRKEEGGVDVKAAREGEEKVDEAEAIQGVLDEDAVEEVSNEEEEKEKDAGACGRAWRAGRWMTSPGSVSSSLL